MMHYNKMKWSPKNDVQQILTLRLPAKILG